MGAPPATRFLRLLPFVAAVALGLLPMAPAQEKPAAEPPAEAPGGAERGRDQTAQPDEAAPRRVRAARITLEGEINETLSTSVVNRGEEAIRDGHEILIFDVSSYGGYVTAGLDLSRELERLGRKARTVAYVDAKAISAAALAAMSCQEIVMTPEASIGDCAPILVGPQGIQPLEDTEREKFETDLRQRMGVLAEKHGISPALGKAMVSMRIVVIKAKNTQTGDVRYVEEEELLKLGPDWVKDEFVDLSDTLLTVGGEKAKELGIAKHVVHEFDELYDLYPIEGRIRTYAVSPTDMVVLWLNNMYFRALLTLIGLLGIYVEMNTPGFGVPGTIGLVAFGILFTSSFLAGQPHWLPPLMFLAGMALLAVELFVTPGFGILGGGGLVLVVASIVLALPNLGGVPKRDFEWTELYSSLALTAGILVAFVVGAIVLAKILPSVPILGRLVLAPGTVSDGSSSGAAAAQEARARVGDAGCTVSKLRPSGKAKFGDRLVDVVAEGEFLDAGAGVRVVSVRGNRIVVRPAGEKPGDETSA